MEFSSVSSNDDYDNYKTKNFGIYPKFGYFLFDNFVIGSEINFIYAKWYDDYKYTELNGAPLLDIIFQI